MYAIPWTVTKHKNDLVFNIKFSENVIPSEDSELKQIKSQIPIYRIKRGKKAWKEASEKSDKQISFDNIINNPISRAYYKLIEIVRTCIIDTPNMTLHICEAPGGFAQGILSEYPECHNINIISLYDENAILFDKNISKHKFVTEHKIENGNILNPNIRNELARTLYNKPDLITADGGIDNDRNPELTEIASAYLIACEIDTALHISKIGGTFILKILGIAESITRQLIAVLTHSYEYISLIKPHTSRSVNDELYVVCVGFIGNVTNFKMPVADSAFLTHIADIDKEWNDEMNKFYFQRIQTQKEAIHKALKYTCSNQHKNGKNPREHTSQI